MRVAGNEWGKSVENAEENRRVLICAWEAWEKKTISTAGGHDADPERSIARSAGEMLGRKGESGP